MNNSMQLPDFKNDAKYSKAFDDLRKKMAAEYVETEIKINYTENKILKNLLEQGEIEVNTKDVAISSDKKFQYQGKNVIVYMRDWYLSNVEQGWRPKIHLTECTNIQKYGKRRYVIATGQTETFHVNVVDKLKIVRTEEWQLSICKNCKEKLAIPMYKTDGQIFKEYYQNWQSEKA